MKSTCRQDALRTLGLERALRKCERTLERRRREGTGSDLVIANTEHLMAQMLLELKQQKQALVLLRSASLKYQQFLPPFHPQRVQSEALCVELAGRSSEDETPAEGIGAGALKSDAKESPPTRDSEGAVQLHTDEGVITARLDAGLNSPSPFFGVWQELEASGPTPYAPSEPVDINPLNTSERAELSALRRAARRSGEDRELLMVAAKFLAPSQR